MKKTLAVLATLLSLAASFAAPLSIKEGNLDDIQLYAPDGTRIDSETEINDSGFIIRTERGGQVFSCDFGDIYINDASIIAITDFTVADPSLYLLDGGMNIVLPGNEISLSIYTPTTLYTIAEPGEYAFTSTADTEQFYNYSEFPAYAYDSIYGKEIEVPAMSGINLMEAQQPAEVTADEYYASSVLDNAVFGSETTEPETTEPEIEAEEPIVIKKQILGYPITFTINDGMTEIEYPSSVVTENDAVEFMAFESEKRPADAALVTYSTDSGKTTLYYSSDIPRETICSYVPLLTADIEEFISIKYPAIPEKPAISISEQSIDIPSAPVVAKPEQEIIPTRPQVSDPGIILVVEPETTVPETTVPETTVPETTVPETTVPETTVPETTRQQYLRQQYLRQQYLRQQYLRQQYLRQQYLRQQHLLLLDVTLNLSSSLILVSKDAHMPIAMAYLLYPQLLNLHSTTMDSQQP